MQRGREGIVVPFAEITKGMSRESHGYIARTPFESLVVRRRISVFDRSQETYYGVQVINGEPVLEEIAWDLIAEKRGRLKKRAYVESRDGDHGRVVKTTIYEIKSPALGDNASGLI